MKHRLVQTLLLAATVFSAAVFCQQRKPPTQYQQIAKETAGLEVSLKLVQSEYFPGEEICATVEVHNRSGRSVDVLPPFENPRGKFVLQVHPAPDSLFSRLDWVPLDTGRNDDMLSDEPLNLLRGRDTVEMLSGTGVSETVCLGSGGFLKPSSYRLCFGYAGGACQEFRVVSPEFAVFAGSLPLAQYRKEWEERELQIEGGCPGLMAAIVRHGDRNFLLSTYGGRNVCGNPSLAVDRLEVLLWSLKPYVRVTALPVSVYSLSMEPGKESDVVFSWISPGGSSEKLTFKPRWRTIDDMVEEQVKARNRP